MGPKVLVPVILLLSPDSGILQCDNVIDFLLCALSESQESHAAING
jgi:hypothetical protein